MSLLNVLVVLYVGTSQLVTAGVKATSVRTNKRSSNVISLLEIV